MSEPLPSPADPLALDPAAAAAPPLAPTVEASAPVPPTESSMATDRGRRRRLVAVASLSRAGRFLVMVALFAGGVALGYSRFEATTPAPTAGGPVTDGMEPPAAVLAMVQSLRVNDLDAVRSSVAAIRDAEGNVVTDPYRWLAGELQSMRLLEVGTVETLSTFVDGPRTATGIIISGRTSQGVPVSWHLIVQTADGQIVSFR